MSDSHPYDAAAELARDLITAQAENAAWRSAYGAATGLGPQSPDEVAVFIREGQRVEREHISHINKQLIAAQQRIAELEQSSLEEFVRGRQSGREDVCKYSNAIGRIESVLGIVGAQPLSETVAAVTAQAAKLAAAQARIAELEERAAFTAECCDRRTAAEAKLAAADATIAELTRDRDLALQQVMDVERERDKADATIARVQSVMVSMRIHQAYHWVEQLDAALTPPSEVQGE